MARSLILFFLVVLSACLCVAEPPHLGPYSYAFRDYRVPELQELSQVVVAYPISTSPNETFPLISFAHGFLCGGLKTQLIHTGILESMASHGFIVAATKSCNIGCPDGRWDIYYEEQLKVILWSQSPEMRDDKVIGLVDHSVGYGIAGHSMGGQATARSAVRAADFNIKAAILLHPFSEDEGIGKDIRIPLAGFTGTLDGCCGEQSTRDYYDDSPAPKTLANLVGALHTEPNMPNSRWGVYMAAFFKVWLGNDINEYHSLIYDKENPDSLCSFHEMRTCEHQNI